MNVPDGVRRLARRARNRVGGRRLTRLTRQVLDDGLTYLSPAKLERIERSLDEAAAVPGDFAEFGVALGGSSIVIADRRGDRAFHGFDVFAMIPEPTSDKDDEKSKKRFDTIQSGASRGIDGQVYYGYRSDLYGEVCRSFAVHGMPVGKDDVHLHEGLFEDTWPDAGVTQLAFAHLDCDWYEPVAYCLAAVDEVLSPGGIVVIDDFHDYGGCRTAVQEFLRDHADYAFEDGPNPILRRRATT